MYTSFVEKELKKCLLCKTALCRTCPNKTPIPEVIALLRDGKTTEAGEMLFNNNPLSAITGEVCPNHLYCKGSCVLGRHGEPVNFCRIEREISQKYLDKKLASTIKPPNGGKRVLIVGSGPAGIALAYFLCVKGYSVTVYEKEKKFGGMIRYGIPNFRLDKILIDKIVEILTRYGVKFVNNVTADIHHIKQYRRDFDIVVLAIGAGISRRLEIEGNKYLTNALDYLKTPTKAKNVIVIGAGNVAMDCALTALKMGATSVNLCYRRDEAAMKAYPAELKHAKESGVVFNYFMVPQKIDKEDGVLTVNFEHKGDTQLMRADLVITAIGQIALPPKTRLHHTLTPIVLPSGLVDTGALPTNIYAIGDAVSGTQTIIEAIASAKKLAKKL